MQSKIKRRIEQFNGREGETATFLSRSFFNSELRGGGFAPRHLKRSTASLKIVKFAFYTILGNLLLILNVSSIAAQEIKNLPFREPGEFVDARPKYCYFDGHTLQDITTYAPADEIILVVARLGERDSRPNLNKRRLHNVFTLWTQQYKRDQKTIVLADAQGAPVKGFGQLEFYVRGRLVDVIKLYGDLRAHDCYAGIDDTPPCGEDWQKLYYPCKDQVIKAKPKRKVTVKKRKA